MALRKSLILKKLRSSCLEGRTALIQPIVNFLTPSKAGTHFCMGTGLRRCDRIFDASLGPPLPSESSE